MQDDASFICLKGMNILHGNFLTNKSVYFELKLGYSFPRHLPSNKFTQKCISVNTFGNKIKEECLCSVVITCFPLINKNIF